MTGAAQWAAVEVFQYEMFVRSVLAPAAKVAGALCCGYGKFSQVASCIEARHQDKELKEYDLSRVSEGKESSRAVDQSQHTHYLDHNDMKSDQIQNQYFQQS